jgi:hypothetical protein
MDMAPLTFVKQHCMFLVHKGEAVHPFAEQNRSSTPSLQKEVPRRTLVIKQVAGQLGA